uniref:EF-hand domain-containing protein n=1 Tax=Pinctada fucata TaxID=50426 RepID=A0A194ANH1_PINFU
MNFKLVLLMCIIMIVLTDAWFWRRRRRRSRRGHIRGSFGCPGGRCSGTISGHRTWNNGRTSLGGHLTCGGGGCGAGVTFTHRFKKEALRDENKFIITLTLPACDFHPYDLNTSKTIEKRELRFWFRQDDPALVDSLFKSLDEDGNGSVSMTEFANMAPKVIKGCDGRSGGKGGQRGDKGPK